MFEDALPEKLKTILKKITLLMDQEKFYLAGGTGLALQIGHRISEDLDFFRAIPFDENMLTSLLKQGISSFEEIMAEKHTLWVILDGVRCSFFFYEVPLLFPPIPYEGLKVADWRDIIAEKFKTISQRGSKKDFFDVFAVVRSKMLTIQDGVTVFKKRFEATGINNYHVLRSLTYFEDAEEEPDPVLLRRNDFGWEEVKTFFVSHIKEFETAFVG
jgi:predicted nucleotidyltransferase component of viral defense system